MKSEHFHSIFIVSFMGFIAWMDYRLNHTAKEPEHMLMNKDAKKPNPFEGKTIEPVGSKILVKFELVTTTLALPESAKKDDNFELFPTVVKVGPECKRGLKQGDRICLTPGQALKSGMIIIGEEMALVEEGFVAAIIK